MVTPDERKEIADKIYRLLQVPAPNVMDDLVPLVREARGITYGETHDRLAAKEAIRDSMTTGLNINLYTPAVYDKDGNWARRRDHVSGGVYRPSPK